MNIRNFTKYSYILLTAILTAMSTMLFSQSEMTVQYSNPQYSCSNNNYCLDISFQSGTPNLQIFGMNVRFFYDDSVFEFISFSGFANGYGAVTPNPPLMATSGPAGPAMFNFVGAAEFVNGSIQLINANATPILISTTGWTTLFHMCFIVDAALEQEFFYPPVVWDLEQNPVNGGFFSGDDGVVITVVDPAPNVDSSPTSEQVTQFNWEYIGGGSPPYGQLSEDSSLSTVCTLPVTFLSFKGHTTTSGNLLEWKTIFETNNTGFEVQRSLNGTEWEMLGFVKSSTVSQEFVNYSFTDINPLRGQNMYRLRQVDIDGQSAYSHVLVLGGDQYEDSNAFTIYPNPVSDGFITVQMHNGENSSVALINAAGIVVQEVNLEDGQVEMNVGGLASGLYIAMITTGTQKFYKKVVINDK